MAGLGAHGGAAAGGPSEEEQAAAAEAAIFEERLRSLEESLMDVKNNMPRARQAWGGAQAPERGAVRGRTMPAPPRTYFPATHPKARPSVIPPPHPTVVNPDNAGIDAASTRRNVHDGLTPGQRALRAHRDEEQARRAGGPGLLDRRIFPSGFTYEGASQHLEPFPQSGELKAAHEQWPLRSTSPRQRLAAAPERGLPRDMQVAAAARHGDPAQPGPRMPSMTCARGAGGMAGGVNPARSVSPRSGSSPKRVAAPGGAEVRGTSCVDGVRMALDSKPGPWNAK